MLKYQGSTLISTGAVSGRVTPPKIVTDKCHNLVTKVTLSIISGSNKDTKDIFAGCNIYVVRSIVLKS